MTEWPLVLLCYLWAVRISDALDLRQLICFTVLAEELHFTRAAARLGISQPRLSLQLQLLEERLGTRLLSRTKRRVELTEAGRIVLEQARSALAQAEEVTARARLAAAGKLGRIRIGFSEGAALDPLPSHLRAFRAAYPGVEVVLFELHPARQVERLEQNSLDVGYLRSVTSPELEHVEIKNEPLYAVVAANHPLARQDAVDLAELAQLPFIGFDRGAEARVFDSYVNLFHRADLTLSFAPRIDRMTTMLGMVTAGMGFAFVTEATTALTTPGVVYRRLRGIEERIPLYLAWRRREPSEVVRAFVRMNASAATIRPRSGS